MYICLCLGKYFVIIFQRARIVSCCANFFHAERCDGNQGVILEKFLVGAVRICGVFRAQQLQ